MSGVACVILRTPHREPHPSIARELGPPSPHWTCETLTDPGEPRSAWRGNRAAWRRVLDLRAGRDWLMVIEDDAELCQGFALAAPRALAAAPSNAVNFYPLRKDAREAFAAGRRWIQPAAYLSNLTVAMRPMHAASYLMWTATRDAELTRHCQTSGDCRFYRWARATRLRMAFPLPGLVQHPANASLLGHRTGRNSPLWCDDHGIDATRINWRER